MLTNNYVVGVLQLVDSMSYEPHSVMPSLTMLNRRKVAISEKMSDNAREQQIRYCYD